MTTSGEKQMRLMAGMVLSGSPYSFLPNMNFEKLDDKNIFHFSGFYNIRTNSSKLSKAIRVEYSVKLLQLKKGIYKCLEVKATANGVGDYSLTVPAEYVVE